jgi:hypothetical protein
MKSLYTPQIREAVRKWLVADGDLYTRSIIKKVLPKAEQTKAGSVAVVKKLLGVTTWAAVVEARAQARREAKAAKQQTQKAKAA